MTNLRLAFGKVGGNPIFPYQAALRAAELIGKIPESRVLVDLFDQIRTYFQEN